LAAQVTNGTYDLETCLALLRLYNFDPDTVNVGLLAAVLLKAMTQLPEPDFHLLLHLIPERCQVRKALPQPSADFATIRRRLSA